MLTGTQIKLQDWSPEYQAFVDKFKPKKTTDDCYTPDNIYQAVLEWAINKYNLQNVPIVRPFYPGGDYERYPYPDDCVVLDNPPFSILAQIVKNYTAANIKYFLFSPYLTNFGIRLKGHHNEERTINFYSCGYDRNRMRKGANKC